MKNDKLNVIYCLPHEKQTPSERLIRARVSDGKKTHVLEFGRHTSMKTVISQIPIIFGAMSSNKSRKKVV
jgi:hypothetical protein